MQILKKKSDNKVFFIFKNSWVITLDSKLTCETPEQIWTAHEFNSTDHEIVKDVAKPANNRFYVGGLQMYDAGTWSVDEAALQEIRDAHADSGRQFDEDQYNITWEMS
jgi:hypothetical protein